MRLLTLLLLATCTGPPSNTAPELQDRETSAVAVEPSDAEPARADSVVTVTGVFHTAYHGGVLRPCDGSDETWWFHGDDAFRARFDALAERHVTAWRRGTRLVLQVQATGTLDRGRPGGHGHLGAYPAEFRESDTHDVTFLALDPEAEPACP